MSTLVRIFVALLVYCGVLLTTAFSTLEAAELFVADRVTNRVLSFDESTGDFLRVVTATGLDVPSAMAFGPGGFLYVSNFQGGFGGAASVVKVDPETGATTDFIFDVTAPGGIGYHAASDTLFVSEFIEIALVEGVPTQLPGNEVFRYDSGGTRLQTLGTDSANTGRAGIAFDAADNLYVSEFNQTGISSVLKYDAPMGSPTDDFASTGSTFASGGDVTLQIPAPAAGFNGLTFDSNGDLFVASLIGQSVIKYSVAGEIVTSGAPFGAPLPYPSGLLVGADGSLIVTNLGNDNTGDPFWGPTTFPGELTRYNGITSTPLLVGDNDRDDVVDAADLEIFQSSYANESYGDQDGDLDTDGNDFLLWQRAVGNQGIVGSFQPTAIVRYTPPASTFTVPEPTSLLLLLLGTATVGFVRQHNRKAFMIE
ncbi:Vgb family protein [Bythopirellula goksoeyrii]|uniref:NHL repeat protein n=1 Tax=Bythopirellula goksoeyrii TaxID=1400387 RepID=A0A5B9Q2S7_9BACT|nr:PEP-CTERM sorting domain-containing protein [Bythopirellula goksoeyrii]QEG33328.1 NHL repeat protein [Bythopirellula goksoeyrii]